jgi:hypothetical protein
MENFINIPTLEGYQAGDLGSIKSFRKCRGSNERVLKQTLPIDGRYLVVSLQSNGKQKTYQVHVLIAMAFHGHIPCGYKVVVDHKDNNPLNNRADNIRLTTNRENSSKDKVRLYSRFVGVTWHKNNRKWQAAIQVKKTSIYLGSFDAEIDANNAYQKALQEINDGLDLNVLYEKGRHKSSRFVGVSWDKSRFKWSAKWKGKFLGRFKTEEEAISAVNKNK